LSHALAVVATVNVGGVQLIYTGLATTLTLEIEVDTWYIPLQWLHPQELLLRWDRCMTISLKCGYGKAYCIV